MSLRRSVAAAVAVATVSLATAAWAGPWALPPGDSYSELSGSFFSTNTFFRNSDEAREGLGGTLEQRVVRSHNEFGWKKHASVWLDVPFVSRTFVPDAGGSVTSTGLGDFEFGVRYGLHLGALPFAIELGWMAPLGGNRKLFPGISGDGGLDGSSVGPLAGGTAGDSSTFFSTGMQALSAGAQLGGTAGRNAYWTLGGGYRTKFLTVGSRKPDERWADFATGDASVGWWAGSHLLVNGAVRGEWPMSQGNAYDRRLAPVAGDHGPDLQSVSLIAGPRVTYRVDDRMDVFAGSWHTPSGRNVLHTDQYYCGIAWKQTGLDRLAGALGGSKAR